MHYLDTSFVVAALTREPRRDEAQQWLARAAPGSLVVSDWVSTEVSSALSLKVRTGALPIDRRSDVLAAWRELLAHHLAPVQVTAEHFATAATFADRHDLGLRAGDALHLAIASQTGAALVTFDRILAAAAPEVGVPVEPV